MSGVCKCALFLMQLQCLPYLTIAILWFEFYIISISDFNENTLFNQNRRIQPQDGPVVDHRALRQRLVYECVLDCPRSDIEEPRGEKHVALCDRHSYLPNRHPALPPHFEAQGGAKKPGQPDQDQDPARGLFQHSAQKMVHPNAHWWFLIDYK